MPQQAPNIQSDMSGMNDLEAGACLEQVGGADAERLNRRAVSSQVECEESDNQAGTKSISQSHPTSTQSSTEPTTQSSSQPTTQASTQPSSQPTTQASSQPSSQPSSLPESQLSSQPTPQAKTQPNFGPLPQCKQGQAPSEWYAEVETAIQTGNVSKEEIRNVSGFSARQILAASQLLQDLERDMRKAEKLDGGLQDKLDRLNDSLGALRASDDKVKQVASLMFAVAHEGRGPISQFIKDNGLEGMARRDLAPDFETMGFRGKTDTEKVLKTIGTAFDRIENVEAAYKLNLLVNAEHVIDDKDGPSGEVAEEARTEITKRLKNEAAKQLYTELLPEGTNVDARLSPLGIIPEEYSNNSEHAPIAKAYTDLRLALREAIHVDSKQAQAKVNEALGVLEQNPEGAQKYYEAYNRQAARRGPNQGDLLNDLARGGLGAERDEGAFQLAKKIAHSLANKNENLTESLIELHKLADTDRNSARSVVIALSSGQVRADDGQLVNLNERLKGILNDKNLKKFQAKIPALQIPVVRELKDFGKETDKPRKKEEGEHLSPQELAKREKQHQDMLNVKQALFSNQGAQEGKLPQTTVLSRLQSTRLRQELIDESYFTEAMGPVDYIGDQAHLMKMSAYEEYLSKVGNNPRKDGQVRSQFLGKMKGIDAKVEAITKAMYWLDSNERPAEIPQMIVYDRAKELRDVVLAYRRNEVTVRDVAAVLGRVEGLPNEFAALAKQGDDAAAEKCYEQGARAVDSVYDLTDQLLSTPQFYQNKQTGGIEMHEPTSLPLMLRGLAKGASGDGPVARALSDIDKAYTLSTELVNLMADAKRQDQELPAWIDDFQKKMEELTAQETNSRITRMVVHRIMRDRDLMRIPLRDNDGKPEFDAQHKPIFTSADLVGTIENAFPIDPNNPDSNVGVDYVHTLFPDR